MFIKRLFCLFLLLLLPTLAMQQIHPSRSLQSLLVPRLKQKHHVVWKGASKPWASKTFKYDDILTFLNDLESGALERRSTDQDLEQINTFLADLAREGLLPNCGDDPDKLEHDIEELLGITDPHSFRYAPAERSSYELRPALYSGDYEIQTCGWWSKKWKQTKEFYKEHKTAIIIGAVVVVVATVVVVAVVAAPAAGGGAVAAGAGGAAEGGGAVGGLAAGGAAAGAAASSKSDDKRPSTTPGVNQAIASRPDATPPSGLRSNPSQVKDIVEKHCNNFKEAIAEERPAMDFSDPNKELSFEERSRIQGAHAAQSACREVLEGAAPPSFIEQEINRAASAFGLVDRKVGIVTEDGSIVEIPGAEMSHAVALPIPNPATGAAVIGGAYAAYEVGKDPSVQSAIANGLDYAKDKVLDGVEYIRDRTVEAVGAWVAGSQEETVLESRSSEGFIDDRVVKGEYPKELEPQRAGRLVENADHIQKGDKTIAGRATDKHGARGKSFVPKPKGNAKAVNDMGREIVEDIVTNPGALVVGENDFGGEDIRLPDGRGIRVDATDTMTGFLEPYRDINVEEDGS